MPTIEQLINYLTGNHHIGRQNPVTARTLALHFGISDGGVEVPMRDVIREAINAGNLIGSFNRGFYIINNRSEVEENLDALRGRADDILHRRRTLLQNWNSQHEEDLTNFTDLRIEEV